MTLGLMSLDYYTLKRRAKLGNMQAAKILPLRHKSMLLLTTLLLGNVAVNAALAVYLGSLTSSIIAGITATALIVIFGEILPQAVFYRHSMYLGSRMSWFAWFFMAILYPVAKPLSLILEKLMGNERPHVLSRRELLLFLDDQKKTRRSELDEDEFDILEGGLEFSEKRVKDAMTAIELAYTLQATDVLTIALLARIQEKGHSRIPVLDKIKKHVVGMLYSKDLIKVEGDTNTPVSAVMRRRVEFIRDDALLDDVLNRFRKARVHLFVVQNKWRKFVGIITMEDVLEEIVGEIADEYDSVIKRKTR